MPMKPFVRTLRAQWLGQQLRDLRVERGLTLRLVATHLHRDMSALGRYERGEWPIGRGDVVALLDLYGFYDAAERARLLALAEEVWRTDRWDEDYGDVVDASFIEYPWLESRAREIKSYNPMVLPGLFQTRRYAETLIRATEAPDVPPAVILRYVELRMERQQVLYRDRPPLIRVVLDESAVRREVGGVDVLQPQLRQLLDLSAQRGVDVRVLRSGVAVHHGLGGAFTLFGMPEPYPEVAYIENLAGRLYIEAPKSARFVRAYDRLWQVALSERESAVLIESIAEEMS